MLCCLKRRAILRIYVIYISSVVIESANQHETQEVRIVYAKKAPKKLVFRSIFSSDFLPASRTGFLNNRMHLMNSIDFHLLRGKSKPWFPNPKTYFAFFWANPKMNREFIKINPHSGWISQIKFWDSQSESVSFLGGWGGGEGFEKSIFDKRFCGQKCYTTDVMYDIPMLVAP